MAIIGSKTFTLKLPLKTGSVTTGVLFDTPPTPPHVHDPNPENMRDFAVEGRNDPYGPTEPGEPTGQEGRTLTVTADFPVFRFLAYIRDSSFEGHLYTAIEIVGTPIGAGGDHDVVSVAADWGEGLRYSPYDSGYSRYRYLWAANYELPAIAFNHSYELVQDGGAPKFRITSSPSLYNGLFQEYRNLSYDERYSGGGVGISDLLKFLGSPQAVEKAYSYWGNISSPWTLRTRILDAHENPLTPWSPPLERNQGYIHPLLDAAAFGDIGAVLVQSRWEDENGFYHVVCQDVSPPEALELQAHRVRVIVRPSGELVQRSGYILWQHHGLTRIWSGDPRTGRVEWSDDEGESWIAMTNQPWGNSPNTRPLDFAALPFAGFCSIAKVGDGVNAPAQIMFTRTLDGENWEEPVTICPYVNPSVIPCIAVHEMAGLATITVTDAQQYRWDSEAMGEAGSWQHKAV